MIRDDAQDEARPALVKYCGRQQCADSCQRVSRAVCERSPSGAAKDHGADNRVVRRAENAPIAPDQFEGMLGKCTALRHALQLVRIEESITTSDRPCPHGLSRKSMRSSRERGRAERSARGMAGPRPR